MLRVRFQAPFGALSDRACKAYQLANQEGQRLNHTEIGTEHLLLGLAKESISFAASALRRAGFNLTWLRREVERWHQQVPATTAILGALPYAVDLDEFTADAIAAGERSGALPLTPELLILALIEYEGGMARQILQQRPLALSWLHWQLRHLA